MQFDRAKFKQLVHYIVWKAGKRDWFGAVKLNKVLWFADARQYALTGQSITGEQYIRQQFGPVPSHLNQVRRELESEGAIKVTKEGNLTRFVSLAHPYVSSLSAEELKTVDYWIDHIDRDHTAGTISEKTHDYAWEIAKIGEELPLNAYRVARIQEPTQEDLARLRQRAKELGIN